MAQITDAVTQAGALDAADVDIVPNPDFVPPEVDIPSGIALDLDEAAHE